MGRAYKKQIAKISIFITSIFIIFMSGIYAMIHQTLEGSKRHVITSGKLQIDFQEEDAISLENALPVYDEVGRIQSAFIFKITNKGNNASDYKIKLIRLSTTNELSIENIRYSLKKKETETIDSLSNLTDEILDSGTINAKETIQYELRVWIKFDVTDEEELMAKALNFKIQIEAIQDTDRQKVIEIDANGGELENTSKEVIVGKSYGDLPIPTRTGYTFLGWYNENKELITKDTIVKEEDGLIKASWEGNQYIATLDASEYDIETSTQKFTYGKEEELPTITKGGYIFRGWSLQKNGSIIKKWSEIKTADNITLYANLEVFYAGYIVKSHSLGENCRKVSYYNIEDIYLNGECNENYISYGGYLWRAVRVNNNKIKMVTEDVLNKVPIYMSGNTLFGDLPVDQWLNQDFLGSIESAEDYLEMQSEWYEYNAETEPNKQGADNSFERAVGLLYYYDYKQSCIVYSKKNCYLNTKESWITMPGYPRNRFMYIDSTGTVTQTSPPMANMGVRPAVYLKASVKVASGTGTKENPYQLMP